ncbi:MAG: type IV pilus biogenesis/stability protein PilW [Rhodoferax sp.]|nr:type IV pilus biogenesis/stability protein PilW [Rhodoferax sp.]
MPSRRLQTTLCSNLLTLAVAVLLAGGLGACANQGTAAASASESYTESDVPVNRKRAETRLKLAVLYFQDGKNNFALDEVKQAILIDPGWFQPYWMRGLIQMQTGDFAPAEASFQKALEINPRSADVKHNYGILLCRLKRPTEASKWFEAAIADPAYGQRAKTWQELGNCQLANQQKDAAEASYMRALELDPNNQVTALSLARLLFERGDAAKAQLHVRRVNNSDRASAESLWLGIKIERSLGATQARSQLETQLRKRFAQSPEAIALERGAFDD